MQTGPSVTAVSWREWVLNRFPRPIAIRYLKLRIAMLRHPRTTAAVRFGATVAVLFLVLAGIPVLRGARDAAFPLSSQCTNAKTALEGDAYVGGSGVMLSSCGETGVVNATGAGPSRPVFSLPAPYVNLSLVPHGSGLGNGTSCADIDGNLPLESGVSVTVPRGSWDYCASFTNATSVLPALSVGWTWG